MLIYTYNNSGVFSGTFEVLDPKKPVPTGTQVPPPAVNENQVAVWNGFSWTVQEELSLVDLPALKERKKQEINASRLQANFSTFLHDGKVIACDQLSRSDIDGVNGYVGINGTLPPGFPGAWKAVDNSYLVIGSVDAWKAFYLSMYNAGLGHFMKSQQLKAQVDACTTAEEIEAIKW